MKFNVNILSLGFSLLIAGAQAQVLDNSAHINLTSGSNLIVNGTYIENNSNIRSENESIVNLKGNDQIKVSGTNSLSFGTVKLDNSQGVILINPMTVSSKMIFSDGVLTTKNGGFVLFESTAQSSVVSDSIFVNGIIKKEGTGSFQFNVGSNSIGRPLSVSEMTGINTISVEYFKANPCDSGYNTSLVSDSLQQISLCEFWKVTGASSTDSRITLSWNGIESCGVGNVADLRVSKWDGSQWTNEGATSVTGNTASGELSTSSTPDLIGSSIFPLGSISMNNPLPIELGYFLATLDNQYSARLDWSTLSEINSDYFIIEKSEDGVNYTEIDRIDAAGTSNQVLTYLAFDDFIDNVNHYALYLVDIDGHKEHLADALLINETYQKTQFKIGNNFIEMPQSRTSSTIRLTIYDLKGSMILDEVYGLGANIDFMEIIPPEGLKGMYIGQLSCGNELVSKKLQFIR